MGTAKQTVSEKNALYKMRHPEKYRAAQARVNARYRIKHLPEESLRGLRHKFKKLGIDIATVSAKPKQCPICDSTVMIGFDHCHTSNKFRGWLCRCCNLALGHARDNSDTLRKLADYLDRKVTL